MASVGYQVVVARLMENGVENQAIKAEFNQEYGALMSLIRTAYTANMITDIKSLDLRTIFRPKVILLVTDEITKHEHVPYRSRLAKFVETGGTLILCCWFVSKSTTWGIEGILWEFRECQWTVAEGLEAFGRTDLALNRGTAMKQKFGDDAFNLLKDTYSMQAINLKGVATDDQVYRPAWHMVFPAVEALDEFANTTPSAYHKYGRGYLGYVGDIKLEEGTKELIVAMLEASISPHNISNNNQPSIANKPHPRFQGQFTSRKPAAHQTPQNSPSGARLSKPASGQDTIGFRTSVAVGHHQSNTPNDKTGARPSLQSVSPNDRPSSPPRLPAMNTSTKVLLMQNGSPIVTSMNAIAEGSFPIYSQETMPQPSRSDGSNTDAVIHGGRHPMHSMHNLAAHTQVPPDILTFNSSDRTKAAFSNTQPLPMPQMTSQLETSENATGDIGAPAVLQSYEKDAINVNAKLNSSQAVADPRLPQNAFQFPITLSSLKPVARNDITALHQFKKADPESSTGEDSYGGGLTIPSVHTDLSGPPSCNSRSEHAQLANTWDAEVSQRSDCGSNEASAHQENNTHNEISAQMPDDRVQNLHASDQASKLTHAGGLPPHQKHDDDDLYEASITASQSKTFKAKAETHAHQAPAILKNTVTDTKPTDQTNSAVKTSATTKTRTSKPQINHKTRMPSLAPCNPGCAVCTILLPASKCTGCRRVQYCSAACQKADWVEHKAVCGPQPSIKKSKERVNGAIQELMDNSQSEDFEYGEDAVGGGEDVDG